MAQEIKIGDPCPDFPIGNILYSEKSKIHLSDLKGKLVILDFWATYCIPCVRNLSNLDSLQQKFSNDVKFISITQEDHKRVIDFFKRRKQKHNIMMVTNDSLLRDLFPHTVVPHYVWIDKSGKLIALTSTESITADNISIVLKNKKISFDVKKDILDYDFDKPLESEEILYRSVITPYKQGLNRSGKTAYHSTIPNRFQAFNSTISLLYGLAFEQHFFSERRLILQTKDPGRLIFPKSGSIEEWRRKNTFCFDLIVDTNRAAIINTIMVNILDQYFGLSGSLEEIDTSCYVLIRTSSKEKFKNKGEKPDAYFTDETDNYRPKYLKNRPLSTLIRGMLNMDKVLYIFDESGITENVTIEFNAPLDDIDQLNKDLTKYDLKIVTTRRKVPFIILRDKALSGN